MLKSAFAFEMKEAPADDGTFSGYSAVFGNVDLGRDIILKGAFTETLSKWRAKGKLPKMLWHHNMRQPIGVWTEMREDDFGLFVRGRFTKGVQAADEAYALLKDGAADGLSIGYDAIDPEYDRDLNVRKLVKVDLWECSLVTMAMNPEATVTGVKAAAEDVAMAADWIEKAIRLHEGHMDGSVPASPASQKKMMGMMTTAHALMTDKKPSGMKTVREFEQALRDQFGYSHAKARAIAANGFKPADDAADLGGLLETVRAARAAMTA